MLLEGCQAVVERGNQPAALGGIPFDGEILKALNRRPI
jgi:hypothetical protein